MYRREFLAKTRDEHTQNFCAIFVKLKPVVFVDGVQSFVEQVLSRAKKLVG